MFNLIYGVTDCWWLEFDPYAPFRAQWHRAERMSLVIADLASELNKTHTELDNVLDSFKRVNAQLTETSEAHQVALEMVNVLRAERDGLARGNRLLIEKAAKPQSPIAPKQTRIETQYFIRDLKPDPVAVAQELAALINAGWRVVHEQITGFQQHMARLEREVPVEDETQRAFDEAAQTITMTRDAQGEIALKVNGVPALARVVVPAYSRNTIEEMNRELFETGAQTAFEVMKRGMKR
jgi:hypothetical protein